MRRCAIVVAVLAALAAVLPGAASGAVLVPLAPPTAWESTPIHAAAPTGDPRLFVVERGGNVRLVKGGVLQPTPFLTVPNVDTGSERGLLSIAFAPDYASSSLFYVFTVAKGAGKFGATPGDLQVIEYSRSSADPDFADPESDRLVLEIPHSAGNHNGGQLAFGPDGYLYITVGDDAIPANAQDQTNLLGKVLRIDPRPESGIGYEVPPSNPFVGKAPARPEIYALGLRNPYRASFAPDGRLVVADVGSSIWEEVNAGNLVGANLGWPLCEGDCPSPPPAPSLTDPVFQYANDTTPEETTGCAIIGGHVVRDGTLAGLTGRYLYGDLCRPDLRTIDLDVAGGDPRPAGLSLPGGSLLSFGEDSGCRLYALTSETAYRVAPDGAAPPSGGSPVCAVQGGGAANLRASGTRRPRLRLQVPRRQKLRGHVKVVAICSQPCALRATGRVLFFKRGAKAGSAKLVGVSKSARAGVPNRLRLILRVKVRKRAKHALQDNRQVTAKIGVSAIGESEKATRKRAWVSLVL